MNRTWRTRLQLAAALMVIVLAGWFAVSRSGDDARSASDTTSARGTSTTSSTAGPSTPRSGLPTIAESELPAEARATLALIRDGGAYPYPQDDATFGNREGLLPDRPRGYYREYTVETPGSDDRGARRVVGGEDGDRYWTQDHYDSFAQIEEGR